MPLSAERRRGLDAGQQDVRDVGPVAPSARCVKREHAAQVRRQVMARLRLGRPNGQAAVRAGTERGRRTGNHQESRPSHGAGVLVCMAFGYPCFVAFIGREGVRSLRAFTEVGLASHIHASLVLMVTRARLPREYYGRFHADWPASRGPNSRLADSSGRPYPAGARVARTRCGRLPTGSS